ncbi:hypothetical protein K3G39_07055 [Pontibacter sp. HSC-14F20]|uniref:hypothetical protein n=1 Tax=Pontibacter sp. HSC-14F20 TaxID=2864136 RepID=UPI001C734225|nr:hypothetical protein [Pontibacter sp. HSC-14F20]MBX0332992.1 hypothetical protein [Pontibacter sp. HSC-14F20]
MTPSVPDKWYSLNQLGKVLKAGDTKESVISDEAFYYILQRYSYSNETRIYLRYIVHNTVFEPASLKYNGIATETSLASETGDKRFPNSRRIDFKLIDKSGHTVRKSFTAGIEAFCECITYMNTLGNYGSGEAMELAQKLNHSQEEAERAAKIISELEAKNRELQSKLDCIYESKNDLRKLTELLFNNSLS